MTRYASDDSSSKKIIPLNKETSEVEQSLYQFVKPVLSLKKKKDIKIEGEENVKPVNSFLIFLECTIWVLLIENFEKKKSVIV